MKTDFQMVVELCGFNLYMFSNQIRKAANKKDLYRKLGRANKYCNLLMKALEDETK